MATTDECIAMSLQVGDAARSIHAQNLDAHIGARIRQCRAVRGRSLQELAALLDISTELLESYEAGHRRVSALQLKQLAAALDTPLSYFFEGLVERLDGLPSPEAARAGVGELLKGPLLLSLAYLLGAEAAFFIGTLSDRIFAPFWPPNVILFCALLFAPYARWWLYAAAALPVHILAELQVGMPALQIGVAFATNCMVAFLSAFAVRRLLGEPPWFNNFRRAILYILIAAVVCPAIAAVGGAFVRISEGAALEHYGLFWMQWFMANALANLTLAPATLTFFEWTRTREPLRLSWRHGEACLVAISLALTCSVLGQVTPLSRVHGLLPALLYLPLPAIVWAAVRFGALGASGAVLLAAVLIIWQALSGAGIFVDANPEQNVLDLQLFLASLAVPVLLLGASIDGARRSEQITRDLARCLLAARDDERRRVGKDLHESTAETLRAAAELATDVLRTVPESGRAAAQRLEEMLQRTTSEVRAVSYFLHPPLLDEAGLETALGQYVEEYSRRNGTRVDLEVSPDLGRLAPQVELALFRLVEQGLATVRKSAPNESALIRIAPAGEGARQDVLLTVECSAKAASGHGSVASLFSKMRSRDGSQSVEIASMRQRAERVGGQVKVDSSTGRPVVRAVIPALRER
jgi:signal transduction histidine kinase